MLDACAPGSPSLVTTPTLFIMRNRYSSYAHEVEALSAAFSMLAALQPDEVAEEGVQVGRGTGPGAGHRARNAFQVRDAVHMCAGGAGMEWHAYVSYSGQFWVNLAS